MSDFHVQADAIAQRLHALADKLSLAITHEYRALAEHTQHALESYHEKVDEWLKVTEAEASKVYSAAVVDAHNAKQEALKLYRAAQAKAREVLSNHPTV